VNFPAFDGLAMVDRQGKRAATSNFMVAVYCAEEMKSGIMSAAN